MVCYGIVGVYHTNYYSKTMVSHSYHGITTENYGKLWYTMVRYGNVVISYEVPL